MDGRYGRETGGKDGRQDVILQLHITYDNLIYTSTVSEALGTCTSNNKRRNYH